MSSGLKPSLRISPLQGFALTSNQSTQGCALGYHIAPLRATP